MFKKIFWHILPLGLQVCVLMLTGFSLTYALGLTVGIVTIFFICDGFSRLSNRLNSVTAKPPKEYLRASNE